MAWQAAARRVAHQVGLEPRYLRRLRWIAKAKAVRAADAPIHRHLRFVLADPEPANFTYELENEDQMASWVAAVARSDPSATQSVLQEAHSDRRLESRLREATSCHRSWSKRSPPFGKRLAWYALVRLLRPGLVVETGVDDGLGALALLRALERNRDEGHPGRLVSFDVNPAAGWIVGEHRLWELRIEPTRTGLPALLRDAPRVGLFIHDSLHTYENEHFELRTVAPRLTARGVLVSDNAHATTALADVCGEFGLEYLAFHEHPAQHFYRGGTIGAGRA